MADTSINNMMLGTHIPPMNQALMRGVLENQSSPTQGSAPGSSALHQQTNGSPLSMRRSSNSNLNAVQDELARLITDEPSHQAEALAAIRSGQIAGEFTELLRYNGMNSDDLADGLTAWLMVMWLIVNDQLDGSSDPARIQAVSNQLGPLFRSMPELQSLTPEQRAVEFERISIMSMFGIAAYMRLSEEGNHEALAELRAAVTEGMRQSGWDLQALTITQSGFEMRR
jgi:hypothetical protein